jgi:hypothetical protein
MELDLKTLRRMAGLTQFQLAQRCASISRMRLSLAECGQLKLNVEEERSVRELLLQLMAERSDQINRAVSEVREAVAV